MRAVLGSILVALAGWLSLSSPADAGGVLQLSLPGIVRIEAGWFTMGSEPEELQYAASLCSQLGVLGLDCGPERFAAELPAHRVYLPAFRMDRSEVSQAAYRRCVLESRCTPSTVADSDVRVGHPSHPAVGMAFRDAARYCAWAGGQLPSEAQWERAARDRGRRRFPWGRYYNSHLANHGQPDGEPSVADGYRFAAPVDAYADGHSAQGLLNMAGNVWELTSSPYEAYPGTDAALPAESGQRVMRGGSWRAPLFALRVTHREPIGEHEARADVGFRCVYNVP